MFVLVYIDKNLPFLRESVEYVHFVFRNTFALTAPIVILVTCTVMNMTLDGTI